jgi:DNA-binding response OmpR family regulator
MKKTLLLLDDDSALRAALAEQLSAGYAIAEAGSIAEARRAVRARNPDAVILDVGLPDGDGRDFCAELRDSGVTCPILMLTANDAEADLIRGLELGADDYIAKPFRLGELMARLASHLRRFEASSDAVLRLGPYDFRPAAKLLTRRETGARIRLTDKEVGILRHLLRADPPLVPKEALLGEVWGYSDGVDTHTLETHIYRLRQKIEDDPSKAVLLLTGPGGYRIFRDTD